MIGPVLKVPLKSRKRPVLTKFTPFDFEKATKSMTAIGTEMDNTLSTAGLLINKEFLTCPAEPPTQRKIHDMFKREGGFNYTPFENGNVEIPSEVFPRIPPASTPFQSTTLGNSMASMPSASLSSSTTSGYQIAGTPSDTLSRIPRPPAPSYSTTAGISMAGMPSAPSQPTMSGYQIAGTAPIPSYPFMDFGMWAPSNLFESDGVQQPTSQQAYQTPSIAQNTAYAMSTPPATGDAILQKRSLIFKLPVPPKQLKATQTPTGPPTMATRVTAGETPSLIVKPPIYPNKLKAMQTLTDPTTMVTSGGVSAEPLVTTVAGNPSSGRAPQLR